MKAVIKTVGMYPSHWLWLTMRSEQLGLPVSRVLRILVELDHRDKILDNVVIQHTPHGHTTSTPDAVPVGAASDTISNAGRAQETVNQEPADGTGETGSNGPAPGNPE